MRKDGGVVPRAGAVGDVCEIDALELAPGRLSVAQKRRVRADGWTRARRETFLAVLAQTCNVVQATRAAGMRDKAAHDLRKRDPAFALLFAEALALGYERLEGALLNHALVGLNAIDVAALPDVARDELGPDAQLTAAMPGVAPTAEVTRVGIELALALLKHHGASVRGGGKRRVPVTLPTAAESDRLLLARLEMLAAKRARQARSLVVPSPQLTVPDGDAS